MSTHADASNPWSLVLVETRSTSGLEGAGRSPNHKDDDCSAEGLRRLKGRLLISLLMVSTVLFGAAPTQAHEGHVIDGEFLVTDIENGEQSEEGDGDDSHSRPKSASDHWYPDDDEETCHQSAAVLSPRSEIQDKERDCQHNLEITMQMMFLYQLGNP